MFQGTVARVGNRSKESTSLGMTAAEEQAKRTPAQERELIEKARNPVSLTLTHIPSAQQNNNRRPSHASHLIIALQIFLQRLLFS